MFSLLNVVVRCMTSRNKDHANFMPVVCMSGKKNCVANFGDLWRGLNIFNFQAMLLFWGNANLVHWLIETVPQPRLLGVNFTSTVPKWRLLLNC